jgi:hypothetical protein
VNRHKTKVRSRIYCPGWAGLNTLSTTDTLFSIVKNLRPTLLRLRVLAPEAMQITSLKKDDRPDPGAILQGITLKFKYRQILGHDTTFPLIELPAF